MKFLQEDSGAGPDELASARDALAEARSKIGTIHLALTPATAKATIDGKVAAAADVRVKAGTHTITIEADGFQPAEKSVDVTAKATIEVEAVLAPIAGGAPPAEKPAEKPGEKVSTDDGDWRPIAGYALLGVAGVSLIASGVMAVRALSLSSDYSDQSNRETYQNPDTKSTGIAMRTGADVAFIIALLAGAGGAVLLFTDLGKSTDANAPPKPAEPPKEPPKTTGFVYSFPSTIRW
jgi:hypothetical protein